MFLPLAQDFDLEITLGSRRLLHFSPRPRRASGQLLPRPARCSHALHAAPRLRGSAHGPRGPALLELSKVPVQTP